MCRPRFRLRTLLVVVAAVAVAIWTEMTWRRWADYRHLAAFHAARERSCLLGIADAERVLARAEQATYRSRKTYEHFVAIYAEELRAARASARAHAGLRRKYERACRTPWIRVAPEPSRP